MTKRYTLGIDVGTTGTKTLLFAEDGYRCFAVKEKVICPNEKRTRIYAPLFEKYKQQAKALERLERAFGKKC